MSTDIVELLRNYDFCVSGSSFAPFLSVPKLRKHLKDVAVFARVSPDQKVRDSLPLFLIIYKELILSNLKSDGVTTLMCGDGTNDVGALKQAHVGMLKTVFVYFG